MADAAIWPPRPFSTTSARPSSNGDRPLPLRAYSESRPSVNANTSDDTGGHVRRKSTRPRLDPPVNKLEGSLPRVPEVRESSLSPRQPQAGFGNIGTPPVTPQKEETVNVTASPELPALEAILSFDFTKIDYEVDRARAIGKGLWSSVYLAQPVLKSPYQRRRSPSTPPPTPQRSMEFPPCSVFAVKVAARQDAKDIFLQEARSLTTLQQWPSAYQYIVPFLGLDKRNGSLVFEGVLGGSLESLVRRLKVMTELERHLDLRNLFPTIANDLIGGLEFIHSAGIVHADIKPANVLLDVSDQNHDTLRLRARYIDFSAAFVAGQDSAANAGGTWDFMAPEQLRIQKDLNTPTFASDIWSLGITLLYIMVGGSPYQAACGDNLFMLREAIKYGDPLGFARMDPVIQKRMTACQDFIDCCRLALQKDRGRRLTADGWRQWFDSELL